MAAGSMGGVTGGRHDKEEDTNKCWNEDGREPHVAELSERGELSAEMWNRTSKANRGV